MEIISNGTNYHTAANKEATEPRVPLG